MSEQSYMSVCDEENVNILENKDIYIHQYLTAIFQISLNSKKIRPKYDDEAEVYCLNLTDVDEGQFSFSNYSHYVFENLMSQKVENAVQHIDKRFLYDQVRFFTNTYRVFDDDSNRIAYLFNCYCRIDFVKDFANLISSKEKKTLKRYIIDQAALLLVCPYVNFRYTEDTNNVTPFTDLFLVLTSSIPWSSEYLAYVKKFFLDVTNSIENAKNGTLEEDDDYVSSLLDLSSDELDIEKIILPIYNQFCKKFKKSHRLSVDIISDIKFLDVLIASPKLAEIFIDLNSPSTLLKKENGNTANEANSSSSNANVLRNFVLNTISSFDIPSMNNLNPSSTNSTQQLEKKFHESLLGLLLCISPLPSPFSKSKEPTNPINLIFTVLNSQEYEYPFFSVPSTKDAIEIERTELLIDDHLSELRQKITDIFYTLLRSSSTVRAKILKWIECCLFAFNNRSKLWANELFALVGGNASSNISDGFVLNLSAVLLNLCKPFCSIQTAPYLSDSTLFINPKMLKVDPGYLHYVKSKAKCDTDTDYRPYLEILNQESLLIYSESNASSQNSGPPSLNNLNQTEESPGINPSSSSEVKSENSISEPNFITRCFFTTHKALHIGFRVIHERFTAINQENNQIQRRLDSLGLNGILQYVNRNDLTQQQYEALNRLDHNMTVTLSMKSALIESKYINLLLEFYLSTAAWINNLAVCDSEEVTKSFKKIGSDGKHTDYFQSPPSKYLNCVPEFIIENIIDFMLFLRYFEVKPKVLTLKSDFEPFLAMIILFMGSPNRMRNPHLRAKMAEMLEALLPTVQVNIPPPNLESLFVKSCFIEELLPALLNVFVSIEISDDTNNGADVVAFEQKFNYRRPMYVVLKYLCTIPEHQRKLVDLATYAESNMDSVQSPIFLRFINLLINDSIFLLDEGLSLMAKLKELQQERESGAWQRQPVTTRQQNEANFVHLGRLAKFHNVIGRDTITTLATITHHVKSFFSHKILVDRMASMLNYFLNHLVGPNKRNFNVKYKNEYEFHPGELVENICQIYVNLACNNPYSICLSSVNNSGNINPKYETFCLAICQDDRSYSPDLLTKAYDILLQKLNKHTLADDMLTVDRTVKEIMRRQRKREIPLDDIPEEFLDPLMSTIMSDPVILPNSRKVVDRATITRHLLSDHTDPYTRTPLTMDMLVPDVELKKKIEDFITSKLQEMDTSDS